MISFITLLSQYLSPKPYTTMPTTLFFFFFFIFFFLLQTTTPTLTPFNLPSTTIPAFPSQSTLTTLCPLTLPPTFFPSISHSCTPPTTRLRCCPTLSAYLYAAYQPSLSSLPSLPLLPDDSESCRDSLRQAFEVRGMEAPRVNESCDVVGCYCGVRLRPWRCDGGLGGGSGRRVERECRGKGVGGCDRCLNSLYKIKERPSTGNTTSNVSDDDKWRRKTDDEEHQRDCQLMGMTWLLTKNRTLYLPTVTNILRVFMMSPDGVDPISCTHLRDGIPLAVDSAEFDDTSSSTVGSPPTWNFDRWIWSSLVLILFV